ncbi:hypothetical protein [Methylobacterium sp. A54F]
MSADPIDLEVVNTGTYDDDGTGDNLRGAFDKGNTNALTLQNHANDRDNPHGVTAHQTGAYTQGEVDALIADLGTISDLLSLLGQINAIATPIQAAATAIDSALATVQAAVTATGGDAAAAHTDRLAADATITTTQGYRDQAQGYRDQAQGYAQAAAGSASTVDGTAFMKRDGSQAATGEQILAASAAGRASLRIPSGVDPTTPVEGALWNAAGVFKAFMGGVARRILDDTWFGTAAQVLANAANKVLSVAALWAAQVPVTLTWAATITPDASTFLNASVTLAGNTTLANPTNLKAGQSGLIRLVQDATGSRTLTFGSLWKFPGDKPIASTAAGAVDALAYYYDGTNLLCSYQKAYA